MYTLRGYHVGEMLAVEIFNKNSKDNLILDYVVVYDSHTKLCTEFPGVGWLGERRILTRGKRK